ncbi:hypothetical protein TNCV_4875591 [Trichonephila clavipes]|nr:hypothetical protein TNCV_4875591 [Trichonephila clavipes]
MNSEGASETTVSRRTISGESLSMEALQWIRWIGANRGQRKIRVAYPEYCIVSKESRCKSEYGCKVVS